VTAFDEQRAGVDARSGLECVVDVCGPDACYDNALAESTIGQIKAGFIARHGPLANPRTTAPDPYWLGTKQARSCWA
jgi:hypothetical protein